MSEQRDEDRLASDEARYGRCPVCGEVLAHDSEEELTFCPVEPSAHPGLPSMLAVQQLPPGGEQRRFLVGATSVDGRSTTIELVLHEPVTSDLGANETVERLARSLIAAGARRGTFHFSPAMTAGAALAETLAQIKGSGFSRFTSLPTH